MPGKLNRDDFGAIKGMSHEDQAEIVTSMGDEDAQAFLEYLHEAEPPKKDPGAGSVLPMAQVPFAANVAPPGQNQTTTEEPAPIGTGDRAFAQNFRNTPADKLSYLKAMYPAMDFESRKSTTGDPIRDAANSVFAKEGGGSTERLYAKPMGAAASPWQAVSPKGDMLGEAVDNAVPIASGLLSAAAGAGAGVGQASRLKGFGEGMTGALPAIQRALARFAPVAAAGAASGTANVGLEAGRELAGNAVPGTPNQPMDPEKLASQFTAGVATPWLFGTGASPSMAAAEGVPLANQRGIPSRMLSGLTTGMSSVFSGIPQHEINNAIAKLPEIRAIEAQGPAGVMQKVQETTSALRDGLYKHQERLGSQIADVLATTTKGVNIAPARAELKAQVDKLAALRGTPRWNNDLEQQLNAAADRYQNLFMTKTPAVPANAITGAGAKPEGWVELPDTVDPHHAMQIRRGLQDMANFGTTPPGNVNARGGNNAMSAFDKDMQRVGTTAYGHLNDAIDDATTEAGKTLGSDSFKQLNQKYATLKETQNYLKVLTADGMKADDKAGKVLMSLGAPSNAGMRYTLQQLDKEMNTKVVPSADTLRALSIFGKAEAKGVAQSSFGSTATEKGNRARALGGTFGLGIGHMLFPENHAAAGLVSGAGAAAAAPLASSAMLRNYMGAGQIPRALGRAATGGLGLGLRPLHTYSNQFLLPGALPSAWQSMQDQQQP